jgi:hypothetical protein
MPARASSVRREVDSSTAGSFAAVVATMRGSSAVSGSSPRIAATNASTRACSVRV